jgi:dTDP-4-dehydrorhamnose 3,5-epimerase
MKFTPTSIPEIILIEPSLFGDERGFFMETFRATQFVEAGIASEFIQDNYSGLRQGALRGLHYQIHQVQGKLLRVVAGEIYDVAVDIRRSSTSFGRWEGVYLSAQNKLQIWIPPGFAHGFYVLSDWAEVLYKTTDYYAPQWERTILWDDADIGIQWPLIDGAPPTLSAKDTLGKRLQEAELFD